MIVRYGRACLEGRGIEEEGVEEEANAARRDSSPFFSAANDGR